MAAVEQLRVRCREVAKSGLPNECFDAASALLKQCPDDALGLTAKGFALKRMCKWRLAAIALQRAVMAEMTTGNSSKVETLIKLIGECQANFLFLNKMRALAAKVSKEPHAPYLCTESKTAWYADTLRSRVDTTLPVYTTESQCTQARKEHERWRGPQVLVLGDVAREKTGWTGDEALVFRRLPGIEYRSFPMEQATDAILYRKQGTFLMSAHVAHRLYPLPSEEEEKKLPVKDADRVAFRYQRNCSNGGPRVAGAFPLWEVRNGYSVETPNKKCDVFVMNELHKHAEFRHAHALLKSELDALASRSADFHIPMYQNIIDPNLTLVEESWVCAEFSTYEEVYPETKVLHALQQCIYRHTRGSQLPRVLVELVFGLVGGAVVRDARAQLSGPIPGLNPQTTPKLHRAIQSVFEACLPLVSKLTRPTLLLPGPVQAVVKAQSIYLKPGEQYEGIWHQDGLREDIIAVALYYYRVSDKLKGGALEFMDRRPAKDFWIHGDCDPSAFGWEEAKQLVNELPHCKVPVREGTLVVFSNYQLVHRVLKMVYEEDGKSSSSSSSSSSKSKTANRDFLAFFIVDQRRPQFSSTQLIAERGQVPLDALSLRQQTRDKAFVQQMQPTGKFGLTDEHVHSTGNGAVATLGWIQNGMLGTPYVNNIPDHLPKALRRKECNLDPNSRDGLRNIHALNKMPPLERGVSWVAETAPHRCPPLINEESSWIAIMCTKCDKVEYFSTTTGQKSFQEPEEGIYERSESLCC